MQNFRKCHNLFPCICNLFNLFLSEAGRFGFAVFPAVDGGETYAEVSGKVFL